MKSSILPSLVYPALCELITGVQNNYLANTLLGVTGKQ